MTDTTPAPITNAAPIETPQSAPPPAATPPATPPPAAPVDWMQSITDEHKPYIQTKGFKDGNSVIESLKNLEKLVGVPKERLLKLPEKADAPEWNEIYDRLGRPKDANGYDIKFDDEHGGEAFAKWTKETFHSLGVPKTQAEKFVQKLIEHTKGEQTKASETQQINMRQNGERLKAEWGQAYDQNSRLVDQAVARLGINEGQLTALRDAMGGADAMKFLHNLAVQVGGEDKFLSGDKTGGGFGVLSPAQAQARITEVRSDPEFSKRYLAGDVNARQEMERLHRWAYGA